MDKSLPSTWTLRAATPDDIEAVADVWHRSWADGHRGHVPAALEQHRSLDDFRARVPARIAATTVAAIDGRVVGFVTRHADEIEQLFVDTAARGGGVAAALLRFGEQLIGERYELAWLAVVSGNARARRFYAREGWRDAGAFDYAAEIAGATIAVPCQRLEKPVRVRS
jgi:GNAT superfamily N-acetyltransferase